MVGCAASPKIMLIPSSTYYPTFNTSDFNISKPHKINLWVQTQYIGKKKKVTICSEKKSMLSLIEYTKKLRSKYNILLTRINAFNAQIKKLNQKQKMKKPVEVNKIPDKWFKK